MVASHAIQGQTIIDVNPSRPNGQNFAPVQHLVLNDTSIPSTFTQTTEHSGAPFTRSSPFNLVSATVLDPALGPPNIQLGFISVVYDVVLRGFAIDTQTPLLTGGPGGTGGVRAFNADATNVGLAPNAAARNAWRQAASAALASGDLLNYITYDGTVNPLPPNGSPDWDVMFSFAFLPDDYLLISERNGNTFFRTTPLDAQGNPINGANVLRFGCPTNAPPANLECSQSGTNLVQYDWNIGVAMSGYQSGQPMVVSVASVAKFFEGTAVPGPQQQVFGLRIENKGNADVKFFGLASSPFEENPPLPLPDYGSLPPADYPTNRADDGARHFFVSGNAFLGALGPDREGDAEAGGDNNAGMDEDGVQVWSNWTPGDTNPQTVFFRVTVGQAGVLSLFMDSDAGTPSALLAPQLVWVEGPTSPALGTFTEIPVDAGVYIFGVTLPASSAGNSIATRWRITNAAGQGGSLATGVASTGEVEDFIFQSDDQGVPVVLAAVESERDGSQVRIRWATASEVGNVGFRFIDGDGASALHEGLIESSVVDSTEPTEYSLDLELAGSTFYIEDIDVFGVVERHGPFVVGERFGRMPELQRIDWAQIQSENAATRSASSWNAASNQPIRLETDQLGPHRVTYADLVNAGMNLDQVAVSDMALTWRKQPVPFFSSTDGVFGDDDYIEFVAEASDSLYSADNIYMLHLQRPEDHRRIKLDNRMPPATAGIDQHLEVAQIGQPKRYSFAAPSADPWFDTQMTVQASPRSWDFVFPVDGLRSGAGLANLKLSGWGITQNAAVLNDHHLQIFINLEQVADLRFDGRTLVDLDVSFDSALLTDGENLMTLRLPGVPGVSAAVMAFQTATISYPRELSSRSNGLNFVAAGERILVGGALPDDALVYRVNDTEVARVIPATMLDQLFGHGFEAVTSADAALLAIPGDAQTSRYFLVDSNTLPAPRVLPGRAAIDLLAGPADYLVISHPLFIDGLAPLLDFHRAQGRTVRVVDVMDIHAQYSGGFPEGQGIQAFLRDAAASIGFSHVLLVGGDTYDYRGHLSNGSISFVPTLYASSSDLVQHMPADALLVDLDGDGMPDRAIGRLPVRSVEELAEVVKKTLDYASRNYRQRVLLAADVLEVGRSFSTQSESLLGNLGQGWVSQRAYLDHMPPAQGRQLILAGINQGQSLVTFTGHSAYSVWTFEGLFAASDIDSLAPNRKPTVVAQWGCWNTYHVSPNYNTMGHRFMLAEDRGAAAVMGSATFTNARSSEVFVSVLGEFLAQPALTIGEAVLNAKQQMDPATSKDMILGWTILGDPAISVADTD